MYAPEWSAITTRSPFILCPIFKNDPVPPLRGSTKRNSNAWGTHTLCILSKIIFMMGKCFLPHTLTREGGASRYRSLHTASTGDTLHRREADRYLSHSLYPPPPRSMCRTSAPPPPPRNLCELPGNSDIPSPGQMVRK